MPNNDLLTDSGYDIDTNVSAFIPVGSIISYGHNSFISNIDELGIVPCDGRSLNTYTYRNLHKIISNIYGGAAYSVGVTDQPSAITTFNVPTLNNFVKFLAMKSSQALNSTGGTSSHSHTNSIVETTTAGNSSFDHGHYWTAYANVSYEAHNHFTNAGFYFGNSNTPVNQPVGKVDGNQSAAGRYHVHSGYVPAVGYYAATNHDHYADGNMYTASGTLHTHEVSISTTAAPTVSTPEYTTAMFYIKI
jgi:hypothetical protein